MVGFRRPFGAGLRFALGLGLLISTSAFAEFDQCRDWSTERWMSTLKNKLSGAPYSISEGTWTYLYKLFGDQQCLDRLQNLGLTECTTKYKEMVIERYRSYHGPEGYSIPGSSYISDMEKKYPGLWDMPSEFKNSIPEDWAKIVARNKSKGWAILGRKPSSSDYRFILHIPQSEKGYEQWFNIAPRELPGTAKPLVSVQITVIKGTTGDGTPYYTPLHSSRDARGLGAPLSRPTAPGRCLTCHVSGMHHVFIGDSRKSLTSVTGDVNDVRDTMNSIIKSYGPVNWNGLYHPERLGPSLTYVKDENSPKNCANCHTGGERGLLNLGQPFRHIKQKTIEDNTMPPGAYSNGLIQQLIAWYPGVLIKWLELDSCPK